MENIYVTREGAARVRPGIRSVFTEDWWLGTSGETIVGSFEHFIYDSTSRVALLFAVRSSLGTITFKVVVYNDDTSRFDDVGVLFPGMAFGPATSYVKYVQIDNKILALSDDPTEPAIIFNVGPVKSAKKIAAGGLTMPTWDPADAPTVRHPDAAYMITGNRDVGFPAAETPTTQTLVSSTATANVYTFAFFYTFETEFGESAPSNITTIKAQRGWSAWQFNAPDATGNKSATIVVDPNKAMDQLAISLPAGKYAAAKTAGAIRWNLYMFTWSDTSPVPSVATLVATNDMVNSPLQTIANGWTPVTAAALAESYVVPVPNAQNRQNYSGGPTSRQGIAVGDRIVLVNDGINQAVIKWSANVPGDYTNFSASKGGGQKTLSSGNLLVPLSVQLWQNPQSTDTIVILCKGLNGYHAAYYMAPASVSGQSDSTLIMGFEETTATPGTISPYGVEVFNNKLYHPLEAELMASSAQNYTITHKTMTTDIANKWQMLAEKDDIVSSQHDGRLYFVVNNPEGAPLEEDCMGNEIWVLDVGSENPTWSRWLIQGISLKKLQIGDKLYMAVVRPDAIFILDEMAYADEYAEGADTLLKNISWKLETNTLGANRQHDAWAQLYQASVHVGDFLGTFEWGVRGTDVNGIEVQRKNKRTSSKQSDEGVDLSNGRVSGGVDLGDTWDQMSIQRDMMEWTFYAQSVEAPLPGSDGAPETWMSFGQIDYVQFMITQMSTNVGYEAGSVETFEYLRDASHGPSNTGPTRNGVPMPMNTSRP